jgi:hypothetical protein
VTDTHFPYREYVLADGNTIGRPVIAVQLSVPGTDIVQDYSLLVDTGADDIGLATELMPLLGISEKDCTPLERRLLEGSLQGWCFPALRITVLDLDEEVTFEAPVVFSPRFDRRPYGLLGREPAFDHLGFYFDHREGYGFPVRR